MPETQRLFEAATCLSVALSAQSIPHAFHGTLLPAVLASTPECNEVLCIVEGGNTLPIRRVKQAITGVQNLAYTSSPWTTRLHVTYTAFTPPIIIEILPAGEEGPRYLDATTTKIIRGLPFLTISEFVRAKLNAWTSRGSEHDAQDIVFVLARYWHFVDINRIPEADMDRFVDGHCTAGTAWMAIKNKYGS